MSFERHPLHTLAKGEEWATAPLMDPKNIGKLVWSAFNGNTAQATVGKIIKIGRTNIHIQSNSYRGTESLHVNPDGETAYGTTSGGFMTSGHTEAYRADMAEREWYARRLARVHNWTKWPSTTLAAICELLDITKEDDK